MRLLRLLTLLCGAAFPASCEDRQPEAWTLDSRPLYPPNFTGLVAAGLQAQLSIARSNFIKDVCADGDPAKQVWLGRRQADLWQYREAIETFSVAIGEHPDNAMLYRHRGHRYISTRNFSNAEHDLVTGGALIQDLADMWEEDGAPNAYNLPLYSEHFNVFYHLGLSRYLQGDFHGALKAYNLISTSVPSSMMSDESVAALSHWMYMSLRRIGKSEAANESVAQIHSGMRSLDGTAYLNLTLLYKGMLTPEDVLGQSPSPLDLATVGYGVGNWHWYNGRQQEAVSLWQRVVNTSYWSAFGFIAAEAELHRLPYIEADIQEDIEADIQESMELDRAAHLLI